MPEVACIETGLVTNNKNLPVRHFQWDKTRYVRHKQKTIHKLTKLTKTILTNMIQPLAFMANIQDDQNTASASIWRPCNVAMYICLWKWNGFKNSDSNYSPPYLVTLNLTMMLKGL